jgi:hypothetical protein
MIVVPASAFTQGKCSVNVVVTDGREFTHRTQYQLLGPGSLHRASSANGAAPNDGVDSVAKDKP